MYIRRSIEEVIKRRAKTSRCLLLTGPRQVGKSTILKEIYPDVKYYTFGDGLLLSAAMDDPKLFIKNTPKPSIQVIYIEQSRRLNFTYENEIDLIIEENGVLYPIEIKKSAKPTKAMADAFDVLDKDADKKRGTGSIVCLYDSKLHLKDDLIVLPIEYI